jgi:hypothetical protein
MFEQKINPEKFFLRDICYLRDTAKAFLHETSASNNKAFDGHSAIQLLANDRFMDRSLGGRSANFAQDPLTCHRPAMSAHLHHCSRAVRQVTARSGPIQTFLIPWSSSPEACYRRRADPLTTSRGGACISFRVGCLALSGIFASERASRRYSAACSSAAFLPPSPLLATESQYAAMLRSIEDSISDIFISYFETGL